MKYGELIAGLKKNGPQHVYLLAGEESYLIEKAEKKILAALFPGGAQDMQDALQRIHGDPGMDELLALIESAPFFADKNVILVKGTAIFREKKNDKPGGAKETNHRKKRGQTSPEERLLAVLSDMPSYSYVIFESDGKADRRRKLYKAVSSAGAVLEAEAVRAWNINEWLQEKLQEIHKELERPAYEYFMTAVSMMQQISLGYLECEFDKLALYTTAHQLTRQDLQQVFSALPEVSMFAMLDAVSEHNVRKALQLLQRQIADGVYMPLILSLLVRHVRQLWQARLLIGKGYRGRQLAAPMELNPFIAEKLGRYSQTFSEPVLRWAMLALADADYYLKTGQAGPELLENVVIGLCQSNTSAIDRN